MDEHAHPVGPAFARATWSSFGGRGGVPASGSPTGWCVGPALAAVPGSVGRRGGVPASGSPTGVRWWWLLCVVAAVLAGLTARGAEPLRIVSQTVGTDELLLALAEPEQIASLSHLAREPLFSAVSEEARQYPQLQKQHDAEAVLSFNPNFVLVADYSRGELVAQLRRAGVRVFVMNRYHTLEDAFANLRELGRELGAEDKAERIIADCTARVETLRRKLRGVTPVKVIAPSTYGVIGGRETTFQDVCDHAGAENLAATLGGLVGHAAPPNERMLTWPVEKVVLAGDTVESALEPYRTLPPYRFMEAVKQGRVALLKPYQLSSVTHHRVTAYEQLARELHPHLFP